jgi:tellurite resistance protein TerC
MNHLLIWIIFNLFILIFIFIDFKVFHKRDHVVSVKEALWWTFIWIGLALIFNIVIYFWLGKQKALEYFTGYLIEKSLSVDNLFVFLIIFSYFKTPAIYQYRVLFYGILVAIILRALFIIFGITLINKFFWILYIFGIFLIYIAIKMFFEHEEYDPSKNLIVRIFAKFSNIKTGYENNRLILKENGRIYFTQLFVVFMVLNFVDLIFAIDSIPAIFAITRDPFIVYTSNMFAILGLRALFFALAGIMRMFYYLKYGLSIILFYIGIKLLLTKFFHIPIIFSLGFISVILLITIMASLLKTKNK